MSVCRFKEFEKKKAGEDKKKFDEIEKFLQKNVNVDPSTMLGKQKHEKKMWSDNYYQKQVALAGKFTFPTSVPLDNTEKGEDGKLVAADQISLINLRDVRFSYDVSTGHFIFNDPISFNVLATTRCGVMGPNGAGQYQYTAHSTHTGAAQNTLSSRVQHHFTHLSACVPRSPLPVIRQEYSAEVAHSQADSHLWYRDSPPQVHARLLRSALHC